MESPGATAPGRRERNKRAKHERILSAAEDLFAERGYSAVTTQDIADRADVAAGTLFRYAASKSELLLMVFNNEWRRAMRRVVLPGSRDRGEPPVAPADAIVALLLPLLESAARNPENTAYYQREILCGEPSGAYRMAALELVDELEASIGALLSGLGAGEDAERLRPEIDAALAARSIFSMLHLALIRCGLGREPIENLPTSLRAEIDLVLHGILERSPERATDA